MRQTGRGQEGRGGAQRMSDEATRRVVYEEAQGMEDAVFSGI